MDESDFRRYFLNVATRREAGLTAQDSASTGQRRNHAAIRSLWDSRTRVAASRSDGSSDGGAGVAAEGVLGAGAFGEDASQQPAAEEALLGEDSAATSLLLGALFVFAGLVVLVGIVGGLRALHGRQGFP